MARIPSFELAGTAFDAPMVRVSREKLYGWTKKKYIDSKGNECNFVNLLDDGKTIIGNGCVSLKSFDGDNNEVSRKTFLAHDEEGNELEKLPTIFEKTNVLSTDKGMDDYLNMNVKSIYQLNTAELENKDALLASLEEHKVLYFPFSYMPSFDADDAFMLASEDNVFIVVGDINDFVYAKLDEVVDLEEVEDDDDDDIDFSMF